MKKRGKFNEKIFCWVYWELLQHKMSKNIYFERFFKIFSQIWMAERNDEMKCKEFESEQDECNVYDQKWITVLVNV